MNMFSRNPFSRGGRPSRSDDGRPAGRLGELAQRPGVRWGALALLILFTVFAGWLGYGAMQAKSSLEQSRDYAQQAKDALLGGKADDGTRFAENAEFFARQARGATIHFRGTSPRRCHGWAVRSSPASRSPMWWWA